MKIRLTPALKAHAVKHFGVAAKAADSVFTSTIVARFLKGEIKKESLDVLMGKKSNPAKPMAKPTAVAKNGTKVEDAKLEAALERKMKELGITSASKTPEALFSKGSPTHIRVLEAADRYSTTTKAAVVPEKSGWKGADGTPNANAGERIYWENEAKDMPSDRDLAIIGAYFKRCISQLFAPGEIPVSLRYNSHDRELLQYSATHQKWTGSIKGHMEKRLDPEIIRRHLTPLETKTVLDDTISGGIEIAPVVFDDALILYPLLYGQLFPNVNLISVNRGRRVKGGSMLNPQLVSGVSEGTSIQPFNTAGFISAFDTAIQAVVGAVEIGLDFEEDTPIGLGAFITQQWGLQLLAWLDMVIAIGDGVTQPLGIFNAVGTTGVDSINGVGGPLVMSDLDNLFFAVAKEYREEPNALTAYIMNDTTYKFGRTVPVGAGDQRRVQGLNIGDYVLNERPVKINNQISAGYAAYVNLRRYRMYRRLGETFRVTTEGRQLALNNTRLITLRARFGGQLELGGAAAVMLNAQNR